MKDFQGILCCPKCRGSLSRKRNGYSCGSCSKKFRVKNGIPFLFYGKPPCTEKSKIKKFIRNSPRLYSLAKVFYSPSLIKDKPYKKLLKEIKDHGRVLDLGSGTRRIGPKIINFDICDYPNVDIVGDGYSLPFKDKSFRAVLLRTVLEHIEDVPKLLSEVSRVLDSRGIVYVEAPFIFNYHSSPGDYYRWTMEGLKSLFKDYDILKKGVISGPSATFVIASSHFLAALLSFKSLALYTIIVLLANTVLKPISLLDIFLNRDKNAVNISSVLFVIARKR